MLDKLPYSRDIKLFVGLHLDQARDVKRERDREHSFSHSISVDIPSRKASSHLETGGTRVRTTTGHRDPIGLDRIFLITRDVSGGNGSCAERIQC